jgi:hypothetical protein
LRTRNTLRRSQHGAIYSALLGSYIETPTARIARIDRWIISKPVVNNPELVRRKIIERITSQHRVRGGVRVAEENLELITPRWGFYTLAPLTYVCRDCGEIVKYGGISEIKRWRGKCPSCKGKLTQTAHVWVHTCGYEKEIDRRKCPDCGSWMRLYRPTKYDIRRWKYKCPDCNREVDFAEICPECRNNPNLSDTERRMSLRACTSRYRKPMSMSIIDLPPKRERVETVVARYFGFKVAEDTEKLEEERKRVERARQAGLEEEQLIQIFGRDLLDALKYDVQAEIRKIIRDKLTVQKEIADYQRIYEENASQNGRVLSKTKLADGVDGAEYAKMLNDDFGVEDLVYVDGVKIVDVVYGYLPLTYDPFRANLVLFESQEKRGRWDIYTVAYDTEGILIILNKRKVLKWLNLEEPELDDRSIKKRFVHLTPEEKERVLTLIHTISHALMQTIHIYSGLSRDNFSEILFTHIPAILIISKGSANLAALRTIFEYAHYPWFSAAREKISKCAYDPICIEETGACHACLYVPEYCCSHWNKNLDRNAVLGSSYGRREFQRFWEEVE